MDNNKNDKLINDNTLIGHSPKQTLTTGSIIQPNGNTSTTYAYIDPWSEPKRVSVEEVGDSVEMVFKQYNRSVYDSWHKPLPEERVYKIIYSCVDGKWNKSEPIFGEIIPATEEEYIFD